MSKRRMTATEVLRKCERLGIYLARGEDGRLYFWNDRTDFEDMEAGISDELFGALIRNQTALLRMVRYMDQDSRSDVEAEQFSNGQQTEAAE